MDPFRRSSPLNSQTNLNRSVKRRKDFSTRVVETDENEFPIRHKEAPTKSRDLKTELKKNALFSNTSSSFKKKILAERKEELLKDSSLSPYYESTPQSNKDMQCVNPSGGSFHNSPISLHSYDPITNYTSPRPKFLRYNPNRRRELLKCIGERRENEGVQSASSSSSLNSSSKRESENEHEEEEELKEKPFYSFVVWSFIPIFGVLLFISYCMISGYPSFGAYESPATNIQKIQGETPLRLEGTNLFSKNLLESFMSVSEMCPIVGQSLCYIDENLSVSLEIDRITGREHLGRGESLSERIRSELYAEVNHLLLKHGGLIDDGSVDKEKMDLGDQNLMDSGTLAEESEANKSISSVETLKENNISSSSVESSLVSLVQHVSDSLSTIKEDKFQNPNLDSIELSMISHSTLEEGTPLNDHGLHNFNFSLASDTELKSDYRSSILSEGALRIFSIFLGLLIIVVGLFCSFHKYFRRQKLNSLNVFPSPPSSEFCLKSETEENTVTYFPMKEGNVGKATDISVENNSSRSNNGSSTWDHFLNIESNKTSDFGPPSVKFLGEFSPFVASFTNNGSGSYFKKMDQPNSQFSYYQKGIGRKMSSPLPDMLDSSPEKSNSSRFSSKVPTEKGELSNSAATSSLRRSSRLRNQKQVTSS